MSGRLLILRPEPGASATAAKAQALGLATIVAPLFTVAPVAWSPPAAAGFDAVLLTSANAPRHGGDALRRYRRLPAYAVGAATAVAARAAGFERVLAGDADGPALLGQAIADGARRLFHPAGSDHRPLAADGATITRRTVYAAHAADALPADARNALDAGTIALLHSPRAAAVFGRLARQAGIDRSGVRIAAISAATLAAAGPGWAAASCADAPDDDALLAAAARMCN